MAGRTAALAFALGPPAGATAQAGPDAVARAVAEWPRRDTGRVQLRVEPVLPDTAQSASWLAAVARASEDVGPRLEVTADVLPPILLVASRERMEAVAGVASNGLTDFRTPALLLVYSEPPNQLAIRHELGHWLVAAAWAGPWPPAWIHEGMATWAQGECSGAGIRGVAAALAVVAEDPEVLKTLLDVIEYKPRFDAAGIWAPIGFRDEPGGPFRPCDEEAKDFIGWPRRLAVHPGVVPARGGLGLQPGPVHHAPAAARRRSLAPDEVHGVRPAPAWRHVRRAHPCHRGGRGAHRPALGAGRGAGARGKRRRAAGPAAAHGARGWRGPDAAPAHRCTRAGAATISSMSRPTKTPRPARWPICRARAQARAGRAPAHRGAVARRAGRLAARPAGAAGGHHAADAAAGGQFAQQPHGLDAVEAEQQAILDRCRATGTWMLSDEVYERLYYRGDTASGAAPSFLDIARPDDRLVVVQSFSKAFLMTGWRLG